MDTSFTAYIHSIIWSSLVTVQSVHIITDNCCFTFAINQQPQQDRTYHCNALSTTVSLNCSRKSTSLVSQQYCFTFHITTGLSLRTISSKFYRSWNERNSPARRHLSTQFSSHSASQPLTFHLILCFRWKFKKH